MNRSFEISKNRIVCSLFVLMAVMLAGCGKSGYIPEGYWKLVEITENDKTVKEDRLKDYGLDDAYISMAYDGDPSSGCAVIFGVPSTFTCFKDEGYVAFISAGRANYAYSGKKLTLADENVKMVFEKSKDKAPKIPEEPDSIQYAVNDGSHEGAVGTAKKEGSLFSGAGDQELGYEDENEDTASGEDEGYDDSNDGTYDLSYSNPREYFEGDWYGWMTVTGRTDFWKQIDGEVYDAMCRVEMDDDNFGTVTIFDAGMPYEEPMARVKVVVNDAGSDPKKGHMADDNSGFFLDGDFDMHNKWDIDPGVFDWSNYMMITGTYIDGNEEEAMDYVFHFKKWGDDWSDFAQKPPHFDWYRKLIDAGKPMPDAPPED